MQTETKMQTLLENVNKAHLADWLHNPVTKILLEQLNIDLWTIAENWVRGSYTGPSADETLQLNSQAIGQAVAIQDIVAFIKDDLPTMVKETSEDEV